MPAQTIGAKVVKRTMKASGPFKAGTVITVFNLVDNGSGSYTVMGVDAAGNQVDISSVATLAAVSDTPAVIAAGVTSGMTFSVTAGTPPPAIGASAKITLTATWNDGSVGPFSTTVTGTIQAGNVVGIVVTG